MIPVRSYGLTKISRREYLGIYAKARGMFYYKGHKYPIEFESIDDLSSKAPVSVVIEKDGVPSCTGAICRQVRRGTGKHTRKLRGLC